MNSYPPSSFPFFFSSFSFFTVGVFQLFICLHRLDILSIHLTIKSSFEPLLNLLPLPLDPSSGPTDHTAGHILISFIRIRSFPSEWFRLDNHCSVVLILNSSVLRKVSVFCTHPADQGSGMTCFSSVPDTSPVPLLIYPTTTNANFAKTTY